MPIASSNSRRLYFLLGSHLGTAVSQSKAGARMNDVRDEGRDVGQRYGQLPDKDGVFLSSHARALSNGALRFHTDRCDVVSLLCVRQARIGGHSQLVSTPAIHNAMLERRPDLLRCSIRAIGAIDWRGRRRTGPALLPAGLRHARRPIHQPLFTHLRRSRAAPAASAETDPGAKRGARSLAVIAAELSFGNDAGAGRHPAPQQPRDLSRARRLRERSGKWPRPVC